MGEFKEGELLLVNNGTHDGWQVAVYSSYNAKVPCYNVRPILYNGEQFSIDLAYLHCKSFKKSNFITI